MRKEGEILVSRHELLAYIYKRLGEVFPDATTNYEGRCVKLGETLLMRPANGPYFPLVVEKAYVAYHETLLGTDRCAAGRRVIDLIKASGNVSAYAVHILPLDDDRCLIVWGVVRKEDVISRYMLGDKKGATTKTATETAAGITPKPPLPRWKSHKVVEAFKIREIRRKTYIPTLGEIFSLLGGDDSDPVSVDVLLEYISKHSPKPGGYYVRYEDGYKSFSPAAAFESGYTRIPEQSEADIAPLPEFQRFESTSKPTHAKVNELVAAVNALRRKGGSIDG